MSNISEVVRTPLGFLPPPVKEPDELCPVQLWWLAKENFAWNIETFGFVFGWQASTIERWAWGQQKASKAASIHAAELRDRWVKEGRIWVKK